MFIMSASLAPDTSEQQRQFFFVFVITFHILQLVNVHRIGRFHIIHGDQDLICLCLRLVLGRFRFIEDLLRHVLVCLFRDPGMVWFIRLRVAGVFPAIR